MYSPQGGCLSPCRTARNVRQQGGLPIKIGGWGLKRGHRRESPERRRIPNKTPRQKKRFGGIREMRITHLESAAKRENAASGCLPLGGFAVSTRPRRPFSRRASGCRRRSGGRCGRGAPPSASPLQGSHVVEVCLSKLVAQGIEGRVVQLEQRQLHRLAGSLPLAGLFRIFCLQYGQSLFCH